MIRIYPCAPLFAGANLQQKGPVLADRPSLLIEARDQLPKWTRRRTPYIRGSPYITLCAPIDWYTPVLVMM